MRGCSLLGSQIYSYDHRVVGSFIHTWIDFLCLVVELNLPPYEFRLKADEEKTYIWDAIRKKYLVLTPEEWVRQNFIEFLAQNKGYPKNLMTLELDLVYNKMDKRSDIVCHNTEGERVLLVECKRPTVQITQKTFDQIARYNMTLKVELLAVTNGIDHYFCQIDHDNGKYQFIRELPNFTELQTN